MNLERVILLVEDNDDDAELAIRAFQKAQIPNAVVRVRDGVEAIDYLLAVGSRAARRVEDAPAVVLLDLNLPRLSGLDVLRAIRGDARIRHVPVVMLTSSNEQEDRLAAYEALANSYVRKPVDFEEFVEMSRTLGRYWLDLNRTLPPKAS